MTIFFSGRDIFFLDHALKIEPMGLMHNYVIQCMRVRLGGIAKQVPRVCVPFLRTGSKYTSLIRKLSGINGGLNSIHLQRKNSTH